MKPRHSQSETPDIEERRFADDDDEAPHLRSFVVAAEELHFGRAAKRLGVSQPTLSRRIRLLEEHLQIELFDRGSQPLCLTLAGLAFVEDARLALRHSRRAVEQARAAGRGELGHLAVAAISWANNAIVPDALRAFHARAPNVSLELYTTSPRAQVDALQKQRLDVGFTAFARWINDRPELRIEPVLEEPLVALVARDHPLARRSTVSVADLANQHLIVLADAVTPGLVDKQVSIFHEWGLSPPPVLDAYDPWAMQALIAAGIGVGMHMASFSNVRHRGIAFVPLESDAPTATLFMLSRRNDDRELIRAFRESTHQAVKTREPPEVLRHNLPRQRRRRGGS